MFRCFRKVCCFSSEVPRINGNYAEKGIILVQNGIPFIKDKEAGSAKLFYDQVFWGKKE